METTDSKEIKMIKIWIYQNFLIDTPDDSSPLNPHFLSLLSMGDGENFPMTKLDSAQGLFLVAQGENICLENGGENIQRCEHCSSM